MATAQLSSNKCSMCEDLIGALFCCDCEKLLCLHCRSFHDRIPSTKGHVVIDSHKEGHGIFKPKPVCTTHQMEFFSVCKDCDCLICNECILSTHNGHRLGTIKETTDTSRMAIQDILENLKSKVKMTSVMMKEIRSNMLPKLQSDCKNFNGMVSSTANEFLQIINHITTISKTRANDFYQLEKEPILEYLAYLECLQESYNKTCTQFENILPEKHDVTFLSAKKMLQKDLDNLEDIPQMIETKNLDAFQRGDFVNSVIEEIRQKFTVGFPKLEYSAQKEESGPTRKEPVIQERIKQDDKDTTDDEFGKPYVVESRSDSIVLQWRTEQELTANEAYHIVFKEYSHGKWRPYVSIRKCIRPKVTISGLKASTSYIFKVKITDAYTGEEGSLSIESDPIRTKESPALGILTRAELIKNGPPKIYRLPLVENISARNEMAKTRKFFIGKKGTDTTERTVMIVGATGSGKITLINGMANYIMGVTWEDPFRFTLINMEKCEKAREHAQAHSKTEWITCYTIYNNISDKVNYTVNLIETPEFGDTGGLEQDAKIVEQIRKLFTSKGEQGVTTLDSVCFILKAPYARLTATQTYIFEFILSFFGNDIKDNICTLITFADGQRPPVLSGIQAIDGIPLPYETYFTFNSSALFVDNTINTPNNLSEVFWDMGNKSCQMFFHHLTTLQTKRISLTTEVLRKRHKVENTVVNLQQEIEVGRAKKHVLEKEVAIFSQNTQSILQNKHFEYEVVEDFQEKVELTAKGLFTTTCLTCNFTCHQHCVFANDSEKEKCCAMNNEGSCMQCPKGCHWKLHHNVPYIIKWSKRRVKKRYDDMKKKYEEATKKTLTHDQLLDQMSQDFSRQEQAIQVMMEIITKHNNRLKEIALRPGPLSTVQYIDLMIASEKREKKLGFEDRIDALEKCKKRATSGQTVQIFQDRIRNTRQTMAAGAIVDESLKDEDPVVGRIKDFFRIEKK